MLGFQQDLRMLMSQKQERFPWTHTNIAKADVVQADLPDI